MPALASLPAFRQAVEEFAVTDLEIAVEPAAQDAAMAGRVLAAAAGTRTLVAAGNAHTPVRPGGLGVPLGAVLAARCPGVREIRIDYQAGRFYNLTPRRFGPRTGARHLRPRLVLRNENLTLVLPAATEAVVPPRAGLSGSIQGGDSGSPGSAG
jgi:hypothetical protein